MDVTKGCSTDFLKPNMVYESQTRPCNSDEFNPIIQIFKLAGIQVHCCNPLPPPCKFCVGGNPKAQENNRSACADSSRMASNLASVMQLALNRRNAKERTAGCNYGPYICRKQACRMSYELRACTSIILLAVQVTGLLSSDWVVCCPNSHFLSAECGECFVDQNGAISF